MDSIQRLSVQLLGFWLVIIGIAVVFGVLYAIGAAVRRKKQHPGRADAAGRGP